MPYKDKKIDAEYHKKYLIKWKQEHAGKYPEYFKRYRERHREQLRQASKEYWKKEMLSRPKKKCIACCTEFSGRLNKIYCSDKCRNKLRFQRRGKTDSYIKLQKIRHKKYSKSTKGKINRIKKYQKRKKKFNNEELPSEDTIRMVDARDIKCIYCKKKFIDGSEEDDESYDHLNAFKPHSEINTVKACRSCNSSKQDDDVLEWLNKKGFKPSPIILELLEKQKQEELNEDENRKRLDTNQTEENR
jgi:predicted nucleic acid-binding Zn ribbon protein